MKSILMIMNARDIPECILSIKALHIDKVWFRGFTEKQLEGQIRQFVQSTDYDYYILVSDDTIVTQFALDNLLKYQTRAQVVTGWCNIFPATTLSSLELEPIIESKDRTQIYFRVRDNIPKWSLPVIKQIYRHTPIKNIINHFLYQHFPDEDDIWRLPEVFRTYFVNWALTSISRELWLRYGFNYPISKYAGHGSDQQMSIDLAKDSIVMLCARDSFIYHLGSVRNFIVGKVQPEVILDTLDLQRTRIESEQISYDYINELL